jgi:hypothetical protein
VKRRKYRRGGEQVDRISRLRRHLVQTARLAISIRPFHHWLKPNPAALAVKPGDNAIVRLTPQMIAEKLRVRL